MSISTRSARLNSSLTAGHRLDRHAPHLARLREVVADPPLGDARQRELAADEGGDQQAEESEGRAQHAAEARGSGGSRRGGRRAAGARRRGAPARVRAGQAPGHGEAAHDDLPQASRSAGASVRPTVAAPAAGVTRSAPGELATVRP